MVRNSLIYVSYKHRKQVATDLKTIYTAATATAAEQNLDAFAEKWDNLWSSRTFYDKVFSASYKSNA